MGAATLAERLTTWLGEHRWTAQHFADEVGVHQALVSKWLHADPRRRVLPGMQNIRRIATVTGLDEEQLRAMVLAEQTERAHARTEPIMPSSKAVSAQRQSILADLDRWLAAVGPDYEPYFWQSLRAHGESQSKLLHQLSSADNAPEHAAANAVAKARGRGKNSGPGEGEPPLRRDYMTASGVLTLAGAHS